MSSINVNEYAGKAIRELRLSKNLTLNELAAKIKISYQQLQKYEKGTNRLSIDKLYEISKYLGMEVYNFFPNGSFVFDKENIITSQLINSYSSINDKETKEIVIRLIDKLAEGKPTEKVAG